MATTHITPEKDAVISEIFIAAPPERVFKALTTREQALPWGSNPDFETTQREVGLCRKRAQRLRQLRQHRPRPSRRDSQIRSTASAGVHLVCKLALRPAAQNDRPLGVVFRPEWYAGKSDSQQFGSNARGLQRLCQGWPGLVTRIKQFVESNPLDV